MGSALLALSLLGSAAASRSPRSPAVLAAGQKEEPLSNGMYLARVGLAGAISCSITHTLVVPFDVVKTSMQTMTNVGPWAATMHVVRERGARALLKGARPTMVGYWLQGAAKFGGYEFLKMTGRRVFWEKDGVVHEPATLAERVPLMLASAGFAEIAACALLCPLETGALCTSARPRALRMRRRARLSLARRTCARRVAALPVSVKLRMQMGMGAAGGGFVATFRGIVRDEGFRTLYRGFTPIALRQVRRGGRQGQSRAPASAVRGRRAGVSAAGV
jgi:hypothetical protein